MKKIVKRLLLLLTILSIFSINISVKADFDKPVAPTELKASIINMSNTILDTVYNKRTNKIKYPTLESYIVYIDNVNDKLTTLKNTFRSSDIRFTILTYISSGLNNIKISVQNEIFLNSIAEATNDNTNTGITTDTGSYIDTCFKSLEIGILKLCDSGKKDVFTNINNNCPSGYHVPNYWEIKFVLDAGVDLKTTFTGAYFINSLYGDINSSSDSKFRSIPYILDYCDNISSFCSGLGLSMLPYGYASTGSKNNILCINNNSQLPTNDQKGSSWSACELTRDKNTGDISAFDGLKGLYHNIDRKFILRDEKINLVSSGTTLKNGKIDYNLTLHCDINGPLQKIEEVKKIYSCNYGYALKDNDCIVDNTICNLENLGNTHPTNSKVCSRKELGNEKSVLGKSNRIIKEINLNCGGSLYPDCESLMTNLYLLSEKIKTDTLKKYNDTYNNKVDIKLTGSLSSELESFKNYKLYYNVKIEGLFWQ